MRCSCLLKISIPNPTCPLQVPQLLAVRGNSMVPLEYLMSSYIWGGANYHLFLMFDQAKSQNPPNKWAFSVVGQAIVCIFLFCVDALGDLGPMHFNFPVRLVPIFPWMGC